MVEHSRIDSFWMLATISTQIRLRAEGTNAATAVPGGNLEQPRHDCEDILDAHLHHHSADIVQGVKMLWYDFGGH